MRAIDRILERISEDIGFWTAGTPCAAVSREEFDEALADARAQELRDAAAVIETWPEWSSRQDFVRFLLYRALDIENTTKEN